MRVDFDRLECRSVFELAPASRSFALQPDDPAPLRIVTVDDVLYLPNVLEPGQSVCLVNGHVVPRESVLDPFAVDFLRAARRRQPLDARPYAGEFDAVSVDQPACVLGNLFSRNFGHWTEEMLKVAVLEKARVDCSFVMPPLPPFARQFLDLLGVHASRIVELTTPTRIARAVFSTPVSHENVAAYPRVLGLLRDRLTERLGPAPVGPTRRRLWLERGPSANGGGVTNRDEVSACLDRYHFEAVDLALMTVTEQLHLIRDAGLIAGAHGSQFVHAQFMPVHSTVIECFSPFHVNPSILQICRVLDHDYHQVVSRSHILQPEPSTRDCRVDCEHLAFILDHIGATGGHTVSQA